MGKEAFAPDHFRYLSSAHLQHGPDEEMKAMKGGKPMTKGGLAVSVATAMEMKISVVSKMLDSLADVGTKETVNVGKFTIPGLVMLKTKVKPARKAGKKVMFGKEVAVKAAPAKTVVKAFPVSALKKSI